MYLMHRDHTVCRFDLTEDGLSNIEIIDKGRLPVGVDSVYPTLFTMQIKNWASMRAIPESRQEIERIRTFLGIDIPSAVINMMAVSLTDCYWAKPENSLMKWADVNFHTNTFSMDFANNILFGGTEPVRDCRTPDITTDGILKKAWVYLDGMPYLVKFGDYGESTKFGKNVLSANEAVGSLVAECLRIPHAEYYPLSVGGEMACASPCFIHDDKTEFVNALQIEHATGFSDMNLYRYFSDTMGMRDETNKMILLDHIIHNADRHEKNFGILRDAETLEIKGFAPLFDFGNSLNCVGWRLNDPEVKPFAQTRKEQLALIKPEKITLPKESDIQRIIEEVYRTFRLGDAAIRNAEEDLHHSYQMYRFLQRSREEER